jgi:tellurite resistance protein TerC
MNNQILVWVGFNLLVLALLALDLGVINRHAHEIKIGEALVWSVAWTVVALIFGAGLWYARGQEAGMQYFTAYVVERALSMDNLFVFLLIFAYFCVEGIYQHRVLFWGILGALVMRALFIGAGITLINRFHWVIYVFGAFLIYTGIKMAFSKGQEIHPDRNPAYRLFRRFMDPSAGMAGGHFFIRKDGKLKLTPLFIVLLVVETSDVVFAVDSIPAVLAISRDPFIAYSSNVMAILGLRALYFALAGMMRMFHHLHYGLSIILAFVGAKMLGEGFLEKLGYEIPIWLALGLIVVLLLLSVMSSLIWPEKKKDPTADDRKCIDQAASK